MIVAPESDPVLDPLARDYVVLALALNRLQPDLHYIDEDDYVLPATVREDAAALKIEDLSPKTSELIAGLNAVARTERTPSRLRRHEV